MPLAIELCKENKKATSRVGEGGVNGQQLDDSFFKIEYFSISRFDFLSVFKVANLNPKHEHSSK